MQYRFTCLFFAVLLPLISHAQVKLPEQISADCGSLEFGNGVNLTVMHYNDQWKMSVMDKNYFRPDTVPLTEMNRNLNWTGEWTVKGGQFHVSEIITPDSGGGLGIIATFSNPAPVPTNNLGFNLSLPADDMSGRTIIMDGVQIRLPEVADKIVLTQQKAVRRIVILVNERMLELRGEFEALIQDNRKFGNNSFSLRIYGVPASGRLTESRLALTVDFKPVSVVTIDLRPAVNMGFVDETSGDRKGGWTDQGKDNDLRTIKPGRLMPCGVTFDVIDPDKNEGRSCLVLAGPDRDYFPVEAGVEASGEGEYLYLLHAAAWTPSTDAVTGKIEVTYADGRRQTIPVRNKVDVANWWSPVSVANAAVVWTTENRQAYTGLFMSAFKLENRQPRRIVFKSEKNAVWMIVGASLSDTLVEIKRLEAVSYVTSGQEWKPLAFPRDVIAGSALDFSRFQDAPAGKYGRATVMASGGIAFEKRPRQRVRFYGTNLCFTAQYLEHKEAEKLADDLAKMGYNSVRMHHMDQFLTVKDASHSTVLNPDFIEKMDYLFYCLKQRGIYITIDLYCSRLLRGGEIPEYPATYQYELKMLIPLFASARENWKEYVRKLICRKNPYTGLSWAEDPMLFMVNLVNEDTVLTEWKNNPAIKKLYEQRFEEWLKQHGNTEPADRPILLKVFLAKLQTEAINELRCFLQNEVKLQALITDNNFISQPAQAGLRSRLDLVDNHEYWDHPTFPGRAFSLPNGYTQRSAITAMAAVPRRMMPSRIFGKPFVVTEFNYCLPNSYRSEGGPLIGAYAGLQDWDGLYRFAWAHSRDKVISAAPASGFDTALDPLNQLADRLAVLLFLRGDIAPAKQAYAWECPDLPGEIDIKAGIPSEFPDAFSILGLTSRIGSTVKGLPLDAAIRRVPVDPAIWNGTRPLPPEFRSEANKAVSDTGEITLDAAGRTLRVVTPRTEALVINGGSLKGSVLEVNNATGFQTVAVSALDDLPLAASRKIICFQLTDVLNSRMKFGNRAHTRLEQWGELPLLLRAGRADLCLNLTGTGAYRVTALALDGTEKQDVPVSYSAGVLRFSADTSLAGGTMVYLIQPAGAKQ